MTKPLSEYHDENDVTCNEEQMPEGKELHFKADGREYQHSSDEVLDRTRRGARTGEPRNCCPQETHNERIQKAVRLHKHVSPAGIARSDAKIVERPDGNTSYPHQDAQRKEDAIRVFDIAMSFC